MEYQLEISPSIQHTLRKLKKKNHVLLHALHVKMREIVFNPYHFKPLRGDMHGIRRVHIMKSFVLTYEIDEVARTVKILDFGHHDRIYG
ncbi:MAG: type II toxin-antitoxin system mRNA interferase toxin, RelE/StbE family [Nanoarchaeota archaeon]